MKRKVFNYYTLALILKSLYEGMGTTEEWRKGNSLWNVR